METETHEISKIAEKTPVTKGDAQVFELSVYFQIDASALNAKGRCWGKWSVSLNLQNPEVQFKQKDLLFALNRNCNNVAQKFSQTDSEEVKL